MFNGISKNHKIDYFFFIIINFIVQINKSNQISFEVSGNGFINVDTSITTDCDTQVNINGKMKCKISLDGNTRRTLSSNSETGKNMFKDSTELTSIDLSSISSSFNDISGMFENCIKLEYVNFDSFDTSNVTNMSRLFYNCSSLKSINFGDHFETKLVQDLSYIFFNCSSLSDLNLTIFKNDQVINMGHMFEFCTKLESLTFPETFSTSKVENMEYMFSNCAKLKEINIDYFNTKNVKNMNSMFKNCKKLNSINLDNFITTSLLNMGSMFQSCTSLSSIDLSKFDTTSVKFMNGLFQDCIKLSSINISNFFTENVIKMESMFENCKSLTKLNLSNFYTPSLRQMYSIFSGCTGVEIFDISKFDTFQVTNFANLFYNCHSLKSINITHFVTDMASDMNHMFFNCSKLTFLNLSNFNTERVLRMDSMFQGCSKLSSLIISNFKNNQVMDMNHMFDGCSCLTKLDLSNFNTKEVKNMNSLFARCTLLKTLDLSSFDTANVLNMNSIFYECSNLESIKFGVNFTTKNVEDMGYMFYDCSSLLSIDLSKLETENVNSFDSMFYNCKSLKSLSVNEFDTSKAISIKSMFHGCTFIETIDLSSFKTHNIIHMDDLFYGCSSLIRLEISHFDVRKVDSMSYMFYECKSLTSIDLPKLDYLNVYSTTYMFAGCSSLTSLNLNNFYSSCIRYMDYMFSGCSYLEYLILDNWDTRNVESMNYMFSGCASLTSLNIESFNTSNLLSVKGMFYGCTSFEFLDLSSLNTYNVKSMEYMFYKASSLTSIKLFDLDSGYSYFKTDSVENMRYMFAYCSSLKNIDFSYLKATKLEDMSFMFLECESLIYANLSNFNISEVASMEKMFYKCSSLEFINLNNSYSSRGIHMSNLIDLAYSLKNLVFCVKDDTVMNIKEIKEKTNYCSIVECREDYNKYRKILIYNNISLESSTNCIDPYEGEEKCGKDLYYFKETHFCYKECPQEAKKDYYGKKICYKKDEQPPPCTIQNLIIGENGCNSLSNLTKMYNETTEQRELLISDLIDEFIAKKYTFAAEYVVKYGMVSKKFFNETYEITTLSDKNLYDNLTYINIQDCENRLKKKYNYLEVNEELILLKIEYLVEEFKIPIIEYAIFTQNGTELNISECNDTNFIYSIPVDGIDESLIYKYDPDSKYNNDLCYQFTTENNTDITLYDRRKEFNDDNLSLCESNCIFLNYNNKRVQCECPIKTEFNQFFSKNETAKNNLIFRFHNNHEQSTNLGILKCYKLLFSSLGFKGNYPSIIFIILIISNFVAAGFFCYSDYKNLYSQIQLFIDRLNKTKKNINKGKQNMITTSNNPPPRIGNNYLNQKNSLISNDSRKNSGITTKFTSKINGPSSLISSKNIVKSATDRRLSILNKEDLFFDKTEMEINMLSYKGAQKTDKRECFDLYFSFLKTRQILIFILTSDYNSFIVKVYFLCLAFGISLGVNTFFFTDKVIHELYEKKGVVTYTDNIISNLGSIILSIIIASIIKSIMLYLSLTDTDVIDIKDTRTISREEKINRALIKVTSKTTLFFITNFMILTILWIYVGSFGVVFNNSQMFLIVNGIVTFCGVLLLPFLYCLLTAALRMKALNEKNKESLYKFSQFLELI